MAGRIIRDLCDKPQVGGIKSQFLNAEVIKKTTVLKQVSLDKARTLLRLFVFLQVLSLNKAEDAHNEYQSLLSEINDSNTKYILRTANRLYGEKTFEFLSVSNH